MWAVSKEAASFLYGDYVKNKVLIVEFPVFSTFIHVEFTKDFESTLKKYPATKNIDKSMFEAMDAMTVSSSSFSEQFIFFELRPSLGTIVHECSHATENLMEFHGIRDDEFRAYHQAYLFDRIVYFKKTGRSPKGF